MLKSQSRLALVAIVAGAVLAGNALAAQPVKKTTKKPAAAAEAPAAPAAGQPINAELIGLGNWVKVCGKDPTANAKVCYSTRDFGTAKDQPTLALAVYDTDGQKEKTLRMLLPVGLLLRPGFRYSLDDGAAQAGAFDICFPNGCFAEAKVDTAGMGRLKKAAALNISVQNQGGNVINFKLPLEGFGKSFDGEAMDPKLLADQQKQQEEALKAALQKRADDQRLLLENQKNAPAAAPTAPAPPAATAPAPAK